LSPFGFTGGPFHHLSTVFPAWHLNRHLASHFDYSWVIGPTIGFCIFSVQMISVRPSRVKASGCWVTSVDPASVGRITRLLRLIGSSFFASRPGAIPISFLICDLVHIANWRVPGPVALWHYVAIMAFLRPYAQFRLRCRWFGALMLDNDLTCTLAPLHLLNSIPEMVS